MSRGWRTVVVVRTEISKSLFEPCGISASCALVLALTPEGYTAVSPSLPAQARWLMNGKEAPAKAWAELQRPEMVVRAIRGEAV